MWDAFLDRTCHSCIGLRNSSSFCKRKTDLFSVEYTTYIPKDIISRFEYSMKDSKPNPKKGTPRSTQSYYEKYKNEQKKKKQAPVYFKVNAEALTENRPPYPPHCKMGEKCTCVKKFGKNVGKHDKNLAVIQVVETMKVAGPPVQIKLSKTEKDGKACKEPVVQAINKPELNFPINFMKRGKSKKQEDKQKTDKPEEDKPVPPSPIIKLKKPKKKDRKKGTILEDRTMSMPLYSVVLSTLNVSKWKIYKDDSGGRGHTIPGPGDSTY